MSDAPQAEGRRSDPLIGTTFAGRYRIDGLLGVGGMGSVYRATQLAVGRPVALKILLPEVSHNPQIQKRFEHEARIIASLHHPNIIALHDFGYDEGRMFLVTELLEGESLAQLITRSAPFDAAEVIDLGAQVLEALIEAHGAGVIHRDLKPENIYVARMGRRASFVKLLDFGIAKVSEEVSGGTVTRSGVIIGSPSYMAPEQARAMPVSPQTDLYALGLVLYEMLAARRVFVGHVQADLLIAQVRMLPPPIERDGGELVGPLVDLILESLEKDPAKRPPSAAVMLERLEACRGKPLKVIPLRRRRRTEIDTLEDAEEALPTDMSKLRDADRRRAVRGRIALLAALLVLAAIVLLVLALPHGGGPTRSVPSAGQAADGGAIAQAEVVAPPLATEPEVVVEPTTPSAAIVSDAGPSANPPDDTATSAQAPEVIVEIVEIGPGPVARNVKLESEPTGALVFRGRERLGTTPLSVEWPSDEPAPRLVLRKGRHYAVVQLADEDAGGTRRVELRPPHLASEPETRPPATRPSEPDATTPTFEMLP